MRFLTSIKVPWCMCIYYFLKLSLEWDFKSYEPTCEFGYIPPKISKVVWTLGIKLLEIISYFLRWCGSSSYWTWLTITFRLPSLLNSYRWFSLNNIRHYEQCNGRRKKRLFPSTLLQNKGIYCSKSHTFTALTLRIAVPFGRIALIHYSQFTTSLCRIISHLAEVNDSITMMKIRLANVTVIRTLTRHRVDCNIFAMTWKVS